MECDTFSLFLLIIIKTFQRVQILGCILTSNSNITSLINFTSNKSFINSCTGAASLHEMLEFAASNKVSSSSSWNEEWAILYNEIYTEQKQNMHTPISARARAHTHTHTHTHTILTRNSLPNSSQLWAWIILISPLPFSKLWLANLLVPLRLIYDTFYITQSHTHSRLSQKYWKDVLPKQWRPATRLLYVTNQNTKLGTFLCSLSAAPHFGYFLRMLSKHLTY